MANRIFYAVQQVAIGTTAGTYRVLKGVQSVSMTTTFNLEQAFELGQLEIYENIEGVPSVATSSVGEATVTCVVLLIVI